jgi:broad specificity phosphatase PhoE
MTTVYLIRHGQAGPPDDYDRLSVLGEQQARLLGAYLQRRDGAKMGRVLAGGLRRQQETASLVAKELVGKVASPREIEVDPRWNEFDLHRLYQRLGPPLAEDSSSFAADWEQMRDEQRLLPHGTKGATGRCDRAVIEAWMDDRYPLGEGCETWVTFRQRIEAGWRAIREESTYARATGKEERQVAIVTSAAPIALMVGTILSVPNPQLLRLMAVLYNTSLTILQWRSEGTLLLSFNGTPHLIDHSTQTFR